MEAPPKVQQPDPSGSGDKAPSENRPRNRDKRFRPRRTNKHQKTQPKTEPAAKERFAGRCDELEGYVYSTTTSKGGVLYTRTTDEVARYAGEKYTTVGSYVRTAVMTLVEQAPVRPMPPPLIGGDPDATPPVPGTVDPVDKAIFDEEIRQYVKEKSAIVAAMESC